MVQTFTSFPVLSSERLLLRKLSIEDVADLFKLRSDRRVNEFIDRIPATKIEEVESFITKINKGIDNNEWHYWAVSLKSTSKLIGTICLWNINPDKELAELGYELMPDFQGLGIMVEAVGRLIDFGFNVMQLNIITGVVRTLNYKSVNLLEKKGFIKDINNEITEEPLGEGYDLYYLKKMEGK